MADNDILEGGGGNGGDDFQNLIPEKFRGHSALEPIKSMEGLVDSFINAQSMVGRDKIALPGKDATDEEWANVFKRLGRPESPDDYKFDPKELGLPEGFQINDDFVKDFKKELHGANLTSRQAEKVLAAYHKMLGTDFSRQDSERKTTRTEWENQLRKDFGGAYDEQINLAVTALNEFGGEDLKNFLKQNGLMSHPGIVKTFAKLGELTAEAQSDTGGGGGQFKMTAEAAKNEIDQLKGNEEFNKQYLDGNNPGHKAAVERMSRLYAIAYPGKSE